MRNHAADTALETGRGKPRISPRLRFWLMLGGGTLLFLFLFMLPDLIAPAHAQALDIPNPLDGISDGLDAINPANLAKDAIEKAGSEAAGAIQDAFFWMLNQIFGGIQATLSVRLLTWLTRLPDFSGGQVMQIERAIQICAGACLGAVLTISIVRFWLGSYTSGNGVSAGLEGVIRTAIAALAIGLWPKLFSIGVGLTNGFTQVLLNDAAKDRLEDLFQGLDMASLGLPVAGASAGAIGLFIGAGISLLVWIIISTASVALFLALIAMKIVVTAGTVIAFVVMPLALVLWPIPETSWVATMLAKATAVLLVIPILWVLIFGAASAVGSDVFFLSNNGKSANLFDTGLNMLLIKPLVACALLYLAVILPGRLVRMAPLTGGMRTPGMGAVRTVATVGAYRAMGAVTSSAPAQAATGAAKQAFTTGMNSAGFGSSNGKTPAGGQPGTQGAGQSQAADAAKGSGAKAGAAAGTSAGTAAAGPAGGAAGAMAGGAIGEKAGDAAGGAATRAATAAGNQDRAATPVSSFEQANIHQMDGKGGPLPNNPTPGRKDRVDTEHARMNAMPDSDRPTSAQTQQAWNSLGASPRAQSAIQNVSSDPANAGSSPRELAEWSTETNHPHWGTQAEDATRVIGEASPQTREAVVSGGQGYAALNSAGGSAATGAGAAAAARGGSGAGPAATPRPNNTAPNAVTDPNADVKRPATRRGES